MITLPAIILIMFVHWLYDFFFQTDEMANNKSKSNYYLGQHVIIYAWGLLLVSPFLFPNNWFFSGISWIVVNGVAHWLTDFVTSRATSSLYKEERYREFFNVIGLDQFVHHITLFGTYIWLKN